jgi:protocatechuate 3,4-dioxygenase beta subunit
MPLAAIRIQAMQILPRSIRTSTDLLSLRLMPREGTASRPSNRAAIPAAPGLIRPPHIHFDVRGEVDVLVTQMYFAGEPENDKDWFLQSIPAPGRSRLTVELLAPTSDFEADSKLAVFDIVLNSG